MLAERMADFPALCRLAAILFFATVTIWPATGNAHVRPDVFQSLARPARDTDAWHARIRPMWQRVVDAEKTEPAITTGGEHFRLADRVAWKNLAARAAQSSETTILRMVNGYFNQWLPQTDAMAWETPEYWASPREFISRRGGDCEDYAIAKYFALRLFGIPAERMRIVTVRHVTEKGAPLPGLHAVLAVFTNDVWFILDNNARPKDNIFPDTQYKGRFVPLYSVNETGAWLHFVKKSP